MCEYVMILSCIDASCCVQRKQTASKSVNMKKKSVGKGGHTKKKGDAKQPPATAKASGSRITVCA